jgi:hypothetical protein
LNDSKHSNLYNCWVVDKKFLYIVKVKKIDLTRYTLQNSITLLVGENNVQMLCAH